MSNDALYLVTGGNGFIASALVKRLVESGVNVRATLRRSELGDALRASISPDARGKLENVIVRDITAEGAFAHALSGK